MRNAKAVYLGWYAYSSGLFKAWIQSKIYLV